MDTAFQVEFHSVSVRMFGFCPGVFSPCHSALSTTEHLRGHSKMAEKSNDVLWTSRFPRKQCSVSSVIVRSLSSTLSCYFLAPERNQIWREGRKSSTFLL